MRTAGEATPESVYALHPAYTFHILRAEIEPALKVAHQSLSIARIIGDPACITAAHRIVGSAYFWRGLLPEAAHHFEEVLRQYDALHDRESPLAAVADTKAMSLSFLGMASALLGYADKASALHDEASRHVDRAAMPHNSVHALNMLGITCWVLGDDERGIECEQAVIALAEKYGFPQWRAYAKGWLGGHLVGRGQIDDAIALLEAAVAESETSGSRLGFCVLGSLLAHALARAGRWQEASSRYDHALASIEATGEGLFEPWVRQGYGEFLIASEGGAAAGAAEVCFSKVLEVARSQGAH